MLILISAPKLGVCYFLLLTLSFCLSVCLSFTLLLQIHSSFFVFRWNRAIFWQSSLHVALYKTFCFDFWFRPPNAQNLLPQIACDNATLPRRHPWLCTQHGSFAWGKSAIHWTSGPTLVAMATKFGLGAKTHTDLFMYACACVCGCLLLYWTLNITASAC